MSTPLHLSSLPTCSPFVSGTQSSCQEDGMKPAYDILGAGIFPSWEKCSAKLEGRVQERAEKEAYAALSLLQQLLCQMYWSQASQLHLADGTKQPEKLLGVWCCQHCKDEDYYGLQRPVSLPVNLSGVYPFPRLHLEFPLTGGLGTEL